MKGSTKVIIGSLIVLAVGTAISIAAIAIGGVEASTWSTVEYKTSTVEVDEEFSNISIDLLTDDVEFRHASDGNCRVELTELENVEHEIVVQGDTLSITSENDNISYFHIGIEVQSPKVVVYLPDNEYEVIDVTITTGDFSAESNFTFEEVSLNITTGDVDLKDATVNGDINVLGTTCDSTFNNVTCTNLIYNIVTGDIDLADFIASQDMIIDITTGDVTFDGSDAFNIQIDLTTGDVYGTLRTAKSFDVDVLTGDVSIPRDGNGGNCTISITTGDIDIDIDN